MVEAKITYVLGREDDGHIYASVGETLSFCICHKDEDIVVVSNMGTVHDIPSFGVLENLADVTSLLEFIFLSEGTRRNLSPDVPQILSRAFAPETMN